MGKKQHEFTCRGRLTLEGVTFFIEASDREEAMEMARKGQWRDWEIVRAGSVDWRLDASTITDND